jgi:hypothetical protein
MTSRKLLALTFAPLLALLLMAAVPLADPAPLDVPAGLNLKQVEKAVRVGVVKRGWEITKSGSGSVEATLHLRDHMAKILVTYDTQHVTLKYLDSSNLDYAVEKDGPVIHRNYRNWVHNVMLDINVELQAAVVESSGT